MISNPVGILSEQKFTNMGPLFIATSYEKNKHKHLFASLRRVWYFSETAEKWPNVEMVQ